MAAWSTRVRRAIWIRRSNAPGRLFLPNVAHDIRVEIPETMATIEEFFVIVTDTRSLAQPMKRSVNLGVEPAGGIGAILRYVEKYFAQVRFRCRSKEEARLHGRLAFFLNRLRSLMSSRRSSNTLSPSSSSPRAAWAAPRANLAFNCRNACCRSSSCRSRSRRASRTTSLVV